MNRQRQQHVLWQRPSPRRRSNWYSTVLVSVACVCLFLSCSTSHGKEIEATSEWTLLGENDTVAAGMHVRIDMTTGEKWVKTVDDDHEETNAHDVSMSMHTTSLAVATAQVEVNGKAVPVNHDNDNSKEPHYDYEMMHRTLSKLPPEEQQRIGGLPKLPNSAVSRLTPEERHAFEARMKQIWEARQEELRQMQNDHLADLPQLLKDRIASMIAYVENPINGLQELSRAQADQREQEDDTVGDIVAVLQDLEYQLTDIDMARDFHTLGGWPILSSLLADAVHENHNDSNNTQHSQQQQQLSDEDWNRVNLIQAHAAWVIGTAVKNTHEFAPYATEQVQVLLAHDKVVKTTALDLVLAQFIASSNAILTVMDQTNKDDYYYDTVMIKVHKTLYALGSMLRANRQAQTHFCADQGPNLLADILAQVAEQAERSDNTLSNDAIKVARRILSLAQDIVMDVTLHSSPSEQLDQAIGRAFSTPQWCSTVLRFLPIPSLYETSLLTIRQLATHCEWDVAGLKVVQQIQKPPEQVLEVWLPADIDADIRKERMELLQSTVQAVQKTQKQ